MAPQNKYSYHKPHKKARLKWWLSRFVVAFFLLFIAGIYGYYWYIAPREINQEQVVDQENINFADTDDADVSIAQPDEEISEIIIEEDEEEISDISNDEIIAIEDHLQLQVNLDIHPDIYDVMHVSRLISLEKFFEKDADKSLPEKKALVPSTKEKSVKIAIVIDDMGASPSKTNEIVAIKAPLTSSFVTFASRLDKQIQKAETAGHEIMIHAPMQPKANIFVSDDVLTVDMTEDQIHQAFAKMLQKYTTAVGMNNHMGSKFTEHGDKLAPIMKLLAQHKMFFLDSMTTPNSQGEKTAKQYGVPCVHRHVFLDNNNDLEYILGQLAKTEAVARKKGYAIAIGHPKIQTAKALRVWIKTLADKNIELVPLSDLVYGNITPR